MATQEMMLNNRFRRRHNHRIFVIPEMWFLTLIGFLFDSWEIANRKLLVVKNYL